MHVPYGRQYLLHYGRRLDFCVRHPPVDIPSGAIIHDDGYLFPVIHLVESDDVWVIESTDRSYLVFQFRDELSRHASRPQRLHGVQVSAVRAPYLSDRRNVPHGPDADLLDDLVPHQRIDLVGLLDEVLQ